MTTSPTIEAEKPDQTVSSDDEGCPNCGSREPWGAASWCPDCGYYPALGGRSLRSAEEVGDGNSQAAWETLDDGPANLMEAIPAWAWTAMAGSLLILLANVGARILLPLEPSHRTLLTLLEFSAGMIAAGLSHGSTYLFAACKTDKFGPFDYFMRPIEIWKPTFAKMPEGSRRVWGMAWGTTAVLAALLIMAGFSFESLFDDWGFEKREAPNIVHETVKNARKKGQSDEDLEGAMKKFAGEGELEDATELLETQCVILGYTKSEKGELESVILGSAPQGRLAFVGLLSQTDIAEKHRAGLLKKLQVLDELDSCYVKRGVPLDQAVWVAPKLLCRIEHKSWTSQYRLEKPSFVKLVE